MKLSRDNVIKSMMLTTRHDAFLDKNDTCLLSSGMTKEGREALYNQMAQLYDNHVATFHIGNNRYEKVRRLNVPQFKELYLTSLKGVTSFDILVDNL